METGDGSWTDVSDALRAWTVARPSMQSDLLSEVLSAIFLFRTTITDLLQETKGSVEVPEWFGRVSAFVDHVAIQATRMFSETKNQMIADGLSGPLRREQDQFEALYTITGEISPSLDLDQVMDRILRVVSKAIGASNGSIMLFDQEKNVLVIRATLDGDRPLPPEGEPTSYGPGEGLPGWVYQHRQALRIDNVTQDPHWAMPRGKGAQTRSLIVAPLIVDMEAHGVMTVFDEQVGRFTEQDLRLVNAAAGQVARAISNAQLYLCVSQTAQELGRALRREQEEASESQAILQSIADGVVVTDAHGRIIRINPAAERILGAERQAVLGQHVRNVFAIFEPEGREQMLRTMKALASNPTAGRQTRQIIRSKLVLERSTVSAHLAPVIDHHQGFMGIVSVFRDITREVQADIAKTEFVSTVSHELRTPLTSIKGYTDLLLSGAMGLLSEGQQQFMSIVRKNADRLTALINDLLDISRIESGRVKLEVHPMRIQDAVWDVVESLRAQIEAKGLALRVEVPDNLPLVQGDRDRLTQVLNNLLSNACRYTPRGEVAIVVSEMPGVLRVDVSDTGIGIEREDQSRIWDRFFRAAHPVVEEAGGTGLGLAIVRMFVEMHSGRIWLDSEPGRGSTFTFILPTIETEESGVSKAGEITCPATAGQKTVLVVEDEPDILALIRYHLKAQGYRVITAALGEEALAKASTERPDLITLDILLPDRDGFDVLQALKANPRTADIPVLILSIVQDAESGFRLGAVDYLTKPIDEQRLIGSVRSILDHKARVLIAEDDVDAAGLLAQMLESNGFLTSVAADGYETLAIARREKPGLILLDLRMPGMDGYEALVRLKRDEETRDVPIIAMSAHAADYRAERERLLSLGAADFLSKPFNMEHLVAQLEAVIAEESGRVAGQRDDME
jgi:PAS domain S-box-containing protein